MRQNPRGLMVLATGITAALFLSWAATIVTTSQTQKSGNRQPRKPESGQATNRPKHLTVDRASHLGPQNVSRSVDVNFDKSLKDATGKMRRVQITKAELLKTPGIRYYAKIDGESRDITYLRVADGEVWLTNVEGTKPEHNFSQASATNGSVAEYRTRNVLQAETVHLFARSKKEDKFSLSRKAVNDQSFALLAINPIKVAGVEPVKLFGAEAQGLFGIDIKIPKIFCGYQQKVEYTCSEDCPTVSGNSPEEFGSWDNFGIRRADVERECSERGCNMCGALCCKPGKCGAVTVEVWGCGFGDIGSSTD